MHHRERSELGAQTVLLYLLATTTDTIARGAHTCVCEIFPHTDVSAIRPCILPRSDIETEPTDGARHSPNCTYLVYIPKVPYRYIQRRVARPNGRKTREYVRTAGTRGPTLCTRRESMRVQVRKSTVVQRRGGGSVEEEELEMARPKVKPNSFSVRLEAALTLRLSAAPYHESLPDLPCPRVCVFSLCILYNVYAHA